MIAAGSVVVTTKLVAQSLPPFTAACLRYGLASAILLPWAWRRHGWPRLDWRDGLILLVQAGLGSLGFSVLMLWGLRSGDAASASVATGTLPILVMAGTCVLRRQPPSLRLSAACLLAAGGTLAAIGPQPVNVAVFAAILCEAAFVSLDRALRVPPPSLSIAALLCLGGMVLTAPGAMSESSAWAQAQWPLAAWASLLWHGVVGTVLGFVCWYAGTSVAGAAAAAPFTALFPLTGLLATAVVLGRPISDGAALGGGLVIAAIFLAAGWSLVRRTLAEGTEKV